MILLLAPMAAVPDGTGFLRKGVNEDYLKSPRYEDAALGLPGHPAGQA